MSANKTSDHATARPDPAPIPDSYEEARDELTAVVERLEAGGLSLDESLAGWERGQALAKACETFLAGAHERVDAVLAEAADEPGDEASDEAGTEPDTVEGSG